MQVSLANAVNTYVELVSIKNLREKKFKERLYWEKNIRYDCTKVAWEIKKQLYKKLPTGSVQIFTAFLIKNNKCIERRKKNSFLSTPKKKKSCL